MHTMSFLAGTSECAYTYEEQPLTNLSCNPYQKNELRLNCEVQGPMEMGFSILWYRELSNGSQPQSLQGSRDDWISGGFRFQRNRLHVQELNAGQYYCQVNLSNGTLLTPSNKLLLDMKSAYSTDPVRNSTCQREQSMRLQSCANIISDTSTVCTSSD